MSNVSNYNLDFEKPLKELEKAYLEIKNDLSFLEEYKFYMKEYVFVGEQDQIKAYIEKSKDLWYYWIETFQLNCYIETANDSFFASNYKKLKIFQILGDSKQEFKIWIPSSEQFCMSSEIATFRIEHSIANSSTPFSSAS